MPNPPVVRLGTLTFNDGPDVDGDEFIVLDIEGWSENSPELVVVERPVSDGAVIAYGRNRARPLTVSGYGVGDDEDAVWRVRSKLEASATVSGNANLEVDEPGGTYRLVVRLAAQPRIRPLGGATVQFDLPLTAVNPAKTLVP
jgi:hypothetical protein